jgi:hypothetical protein
MALPVLWNGSCGEEGMNAHIERLARGAGLPTQDNFDPPIHPSRIEAFARLIAEDLAECVEQSDKNTHPADLADAIRERYK